MLFDRKAWYALASVILLAPLAGRAAAQGTTSLFVMKPDGTDVRPVAAAPSFRRAGHVRWSHDGKRLAFHAWEGAPGARQVFIVKPDGSGLEAIGNDGQLVDWSSDDKQLAFQNPAGTWVENVDGTGRTFIGAGASPRWSPDGSRIAFVENRTLVVRNLVDDSQTNLLDDSWQVQAGFDWSRDGRQIAMVAKHQGSTGLWVVDPQSSDPPRLRLRGSLMGQVAWSPDGKQLAVTLDSIIQLVDANDTTPPRPIPNQVGNSRDPAWSPDGKTIAFSSTREPSRQ